MVIESGVRGMEQAEETALIARVLEGDRRAARELYDAHAPRAWRVIHRLVGDEALTEEYTQDAFVRVFDSLSRFRGDARLATWIHRIAVSVALNGLRSRRRRAAREVDLDTARHVAGDPRGPEPDLRDRLRQAIAALPDIYRLPVVLFDIEGFSHAEIAELTGVPEGTCKSRLMRARAHLREALAAHAPEH
jgi:RNA polymerase sigma-70 factor, ECF subfamily